MHLVPHQCGGDANAALMAADGLHHRRLAHDHRAGLWQGLQHRLDHRGGACAAHLFVKAQRNLQRPRNAHVLGLDQGPQRQRVKAFHIAGAAPEITAIAFGHNPGVAGPVLAINGHHICVPRQHDTALDHGANMGKQRRFVARIIVKPMRCDAMVLQIGLHPIHQIKVAVAADSGKADQLFHQLQGAKALGCHGLIPAVCG